MIVMHGFGVAGGCYEFSSGYLIAKWMDDELVLNVELNIHLSRIIFNKYCATILAHVAHIFQYSFR